MTAPALILIDLQKGFYDPYWGRRNNQYLEKNAALLLNTWRERGFPLYHVQHLSTEEHSPLRPDRSGVAFMDFAQPRQGETVIQKKVNSAFIGTSLESMLREAGHQRLIMVGLTSDHCVSTTTRMAGNLGFDVTLASDATAAFERRGLDGKLFDPETVHNVSLASLNGEFARVMPTAAILDLR